MPRNTREWAHRKLDAGVNNMTWALRHYEDVIKVYKKPHPEITEKLELLQALIIEAQGLSEAIKKSF